MTINETLCVDDQNDLYGLLFEVLTKESTTNDHHNFTSRNCSYSNELNLFSSKETADVHVLYKAGRSFFAYITPIILLVGILGNCLSLHVFLSRNMRGLSASSYLAAISTADLLTLIFYVNVEWLRRGLTHLSPGAKLDFLDSAIACKTQLYLSYVFRFQSAWLVVAFTMERYIGVCHPLRRRDICTTSTTRKIISGILIMSMIIVLYKPFLSGAYLSGRGEVYCTSNPDFEFLSFILDSTFGVLITLVPFVIIAVLNILIMRKLYIRNKRQKHCRVITEESIIKLEFTVILLAISFCFIAFNAPYFAVWLRSFIHSKHFRKTVEQISSINIEYWQGVLFITRTIFYFNYCINIFLYSITGAYFRREVRMLFAYRGKDKGVSYYNRCSRSSSHSPQSYL